MEVVTMYTRAGCGLCDDMKAELERRGYEVREVDIAQDETLVRKYGLDIPVVVRADGSELARHRLPGAR
jgi:glutaredoxin